MMAVKYTTSTFDVCLSVSPTTCHMLRLDGRRLLHERLVAFERQDLLGRQALALLPRPVGAVVVVGQLEDVSIVARVPFSGQAVLVSHRLNAVDHLRRRAAAAAAAHTFIYIKKKSLTGSFQPMKDGNDSAAITGAERVSV